MKKIIGFIFVLSFLATMPAGARFGMMGNFRDFALNNQTVKNDDLNKILMEIYQSQNIVSADQLNCGQISDEQFEKLGDAYMELIHPGQAHIYLDQMMGGEGSTTLKQAHINMGRSYAGCSGLGYKTGRLGWPMMGVAGVLNNYSSSGPFGGGMMGPWMMGCLGGGYNWFGFSTIILFWAVLILGLVAIIKQLFKKS